MNKIIFAILITGLMLTVSPTLAEHNDDDDYYSFSPIITDHQRENPVQGNGKTINYSNDF